MTKTSLIATALMLSSLFAAEVPGRTRLERQVRHELVMLPYYGVFDRLAFSVNNGKVVLLGEVTRPTLK